MADANTFAAGTLETLGTTAVAVTPNDGADLAKLGAFIVAATSGIIRITPSLNAAGTSVDVFANAGQPLPFFVDRVWSTGTTATGILAGYNR